MRGLWVFAYDNVMRFYYYPEFLSFFEITNNNSGSFLVFF